MEIKHAKKTSGLGFVNQAPWNQVDSILSVLLQAWPWHSAHSALSGSELHTTRGDQVCRDMLQAGLPAPGASNVDAVANSFDSFEAWPMADVGWCGLQVACFSSLLEILGPITLRGYQHGNVIASTCFNQVCLNYLLQHWSLWWSLNLLDICFRP